MKYDNEEPSLWLDLKLPFFDGVAMIFLVTEKKENGIFKCAKSCFAHSVAKSYFAHSVVKSCFAHSVAKSCFAHSVEKSCFAHSVAK